MRKPFGISDPVWPLRKKYWLANYSLQGLESESDPTNPEPHVDLRPDTDAADEAGKTEYLPEFHETKEVPYKYSVDGKKLPVDDDDMWIRRSIKWKPEEIPLTLWKKFPAMHEQWRAVPRSQKSAD